jgi:hypothetical protein
MPLTGGPGVDAGGVRWTTNLFQISTKNGSKEMCVRSVASYHTDRPMAPKEFAIEGEVQRLPSTLKLCTDH